MRDAGTSFRAELAVWLESHFGLDLAIFGAGTLEEALNARRHIMGLESVRHYAGYWRRHETERRCFLERLLVGETWFFREWPAFQMLGDWIGRHRGEFRAEAPLRILTLPCASGEEAWSIAAVVWEAGLSGGEVEIEAMDISQPALADAQRGIYPARKLRGQPLERWAHLLQPRGDATLRVADNLRTLVSFREGNALDREWFVSRGLYRLIFCRNMLIYMSPEARTKVCGTLRDILQPDGLLFLGHAEAPSPESGLVRYGGEGAFAWRRGINEGDRGVGLSRASIGIPAPGNRLQKSPEAGRRETSASATPAQPFKFPPILSQKGQNKALDDGSNPDAAQRKTGDLAAPPQTGQALQSARTLADQGRYADALNALKSGLVHHPMDPDVHCLAGILLGAMGRQSEAIARLRGALYLDPGHGESLAHLALLLEQRGDTRAADRLKSRLEQHRKAPS